MALIPVRMFIIAQVQEGRPVMARRRPQELTGDELGLQCVGDGVLVDLHHLFFNCTVLPSRVLETAVPSTESDGWRFAICVESGCRWRI